MADYAMRIFKDYNVEQEVNNQLGNHGEPNVSSI
jgi:hypothetical protein